MLRIGITGGIGGGKSTVCRIFELLQVSVFYADNVAKTLMNTDAELVESITRTFGKETYSEGKLDRAYLARIVFNNDIQLERLNRLVHPATLKAFEIWSGKQSAPYVMKEAAILFESGSHAQCDYTILVTAPETIRLARVVERDGVSPEQVKARMDKQMPEDEKAKRADFIIVNDGMLALIPQVRGLHERLSKRGEHA